jgi:hypothetical protein
MKKLQFISLSTALILPVIASAGTIEAQYGDVNDFTDFSVYGLSEEKTLKIFKAELEKTLESLAKKYLAEDETLTIQFTDIDMAGDIQPWRNTHNADIRYVEAVYPPRLKFTYTLKNADGEVLDEGEASISDLAFQMDTTASFRANSENFYYETSLLRDWMRKTFRNRSSESKGE